LQVNAGARKLKPPKIGEPVIPKYYYIKRAQKGQLGNVDGVVQ
jgi:hypothetical protein